MAEPLRGRLRPARRSGLTSPDPVSYLTPARARRPQYPLPGPRTSRRTASGGKTTPFKTITAENGYTKSVG